MSSAQIKSVDAALNIHYGPQLSGRVWNRHIHAFKRSSMVKSSAAASRLNFIISFWIQRAFQLNVTHLSPLRCGRLGDGYPLCDLKWPSSRLTGWSENQLRGTVPLSHLLPHSLQAHNSSRPVPISQNGVKRGIRSIRESYFNDSCRRGKRRRAWSQYIKEPR